MSELTPQLAPEVVAACEAGAEEAAGALSRSLDGEFSVAVGEAGSYSADAAPAGFDGAGLAVIMKFGDAGVAALVPESSGLLPEWYASPDPTGENKLSTLAQELSMLLMPETMLAEDFKAARVEHLNDALASANVADDAALVPLELKSGDQTAQLSLIWPVAAPNEMLPEVEEDDTSASADNSAAPETSAAPIAANSKIEDFSQLPGYARSLLRIQVPVRVVLAAKKELLQDIVELAAGSIIKFEKSCDETLVLQVGDQKIAEGEAVKVGDKFGFRASKMVMPDEHFSKVKPRESG